MGEIRMKHIKLITIIILGFLILNLSACDNKKDSSKPITNESRENIIIVDRIEEIKNIQISDWLNDETLIVSKENDSLDKMELLELSDQYPISLYIYNINTEEYKLLKEERNLFLTGGNLSKDKKYLLYNEFALGDPLYYVMNIDTLDTFKIHGDDVGVALSAIWNGNKVIGSTYNNNAYEASYNGEISVFQDINEEGLFIIRKIKDRIYYNTYFDQSLMMLNNSNQEKINLNIPHVYDLIPSPHDDNMVVLQNQGTKSTMVICDIDGNIQKIIREGIEITGVSWSPDQRMITYHIKETVNNITTNSIYIYDMITNKSYPIGIDIQNAVISWSPSSKKFAYTEFDEKHYNSSIVYLKLSLEE